MHKSRGRISLFDRLMAAISFAEAGEREIAMEVMNRDLDKKRRKRNGLNIRRPAYSRPDMRI